MPVADRLVSIAERVLSDEFRRVRRSPNTPSIRSRGSMASNVERRAQRSDFESGALVCRGPSGRRSAGTAKLDVELFAETLDSLQDQFDLAADLEGSRRSTGSSRSWTFSGLDDVKEMLPLMLRDAEGRG